MSLSILAAAHHKAAAPRQPLMSLSTSLMGITQQGCGAMRVSIQSRRLVLLFTIQLHATTQKTKTIWARFSAEFSELLAVWAYSFVFAVCGVCVAVGAVVQVVVVLPTLTRTRSLRRTTTKKLSLLRQRLLPWMPINTQEMILCRRPSAKTRTRLA